MSGGIVSGAAVRDRTPDDDDWGLVVRGVGLWPIVEATLQRAFDVFVSSPTVIYVGYAALGAVPATAVWRIKRIVFVGGNPATLQWSGAGFAVAWDDRTTISYT
jgi:hypothetical protein